MANNTSSNANAYANQFFNTDFVKGLLPANMLFPFNLEAVLETQRKNLEAFSEAQQVAIAHLQTIAQRQTDMLTQMVADNTEIAQQILGEGTPEEKMSRQADAVRQSYERSVTKLTEMTELVTRSNREAGEIINKRVAATLTELKSGLGKTAKAPVKTAA